MINIIFFVGSNTRTIDYCIILIKRCVCKNSAVMSAVGMSSFSFPFSLYNVSKTVSISFRSSGKRQQQRKKKQQNHSKPMMNETERKRKQNKTNAWWRKYVLFSCFFFFQFPTIIRDVCTFNQNAIRVRNIKNNSHVFEFQHFDTITLFCSDAFREDVLIR